LKESVKEEIREVGSFLVEIVDTAEALIRDIVTDSEVGGSIG